MADSILVTSHVARDFLQNATYFNTLPKVVWEYVSNSIDNANEGTYPRVDVQIRHDELVVTDNGVGMSRDDLSRFFQMHGENVQRKRGKKVRGKFGTGKTAAFGVAKELEIDSIRDGKRNVVCLARADIEKAKNGEPFPVRVLVDDEPSEEESGTSVAIRNFTQVSFDIEKTIKYVEKQLSRMRTRATVHINGHRCAFREPPAVKEWTRTPDKTVAERIGNVTMTLKAAPAPLPAEDNGVDVLGNGVWHETTLADVKGDQVNRIFGIVDVPVLDDDERFDVAAYDNTRSGTLNRANPAVSALLFWIQEEVKRAAAELREEAEERKRSEEAKRLRSQAKRIAELLNQDFRDMMDELDELRIIRGRKRRKAAEDAAGHPVLPGDGTENSEMTQTGPKHGDGKRGENPAGTGDQERPGAGLKDGKSTGKPGRVDTRSDSGSRRSHGLFSIEFIHETADERRSRYDGESKTIYINLDHPQIASALRLGDGSVNSGLFRQVAFEIAVVEYAQAIQFERFESGESFDAADAVFSIGEVIDRVSRKLQDVTPEQ